jgi:periplasmic divalent cation tolerance protein
MSVVSVYVIFGNADEAERIGRQMIEERLAACVNILGPCRSIYRWQGAVESGDEVPAIFKTTDGQSEALVARIIELHSYEVPAVAVWPVLRLPSAYGDWVEQSVGKL